MAKPKNKATDRRGEERNASPGAKVQPRRRTSIGPYDLPKR